MQEIQLNLDINEVNTILESLGKEPYAKVFQLVNKVHEQTSQQVQHIVKNQDPVEK